MHSTGMSDWNWSELEDINWDVDVKSGDHVVPHQSSELLDEPTVLSHAHKNPRHEVKYVDGRNFCVGASANKTVLWGKEDIWYPPTKRGSSSVPAGSWPHTSHIVVPKLHDHESIANGTAFPSQDARTFDYCVNKSSNDAKTSMFYLKDPQLGTKVSMKDNKFCLSLHNGVSPDVTDLSYIESVQKGRDDNLAYYDWSNINNFEDVDKMFGNCDSTFEHGQTSTADDPSWLSSSNNICGSKNAFEPDFQPQGGELGALLVKTDSHGSNVNFLPKNVPSTSGHDKPTSCNYAAWLDTGGPSKVVSADNEKLDVSTKLCIRESLYRLARSARQRQGFTTQNYSKGFPNTKGIQDTEASKSGFAEFMDDVETNTNPLDRSIARSLFHMPSERAIRSADIRSLEPRVMNEEVLVPNQFDGEGIIGGFHDVETDLPQVSTPIL